MVGKLWVLQKCLACSRHMICMLSKCSGMRLTLLLSVTTATASVTVQMASRQYNLAGPQIKRGVRNSRASRNWPQANGESSHSRVDFTKMKVPVLLCCRAALSCRHCSYTAPEYSGCVYLLRKGLQSLGEGRLVDTRRRPDPVPALLELDAGRHMLTEAGNLVQVASLRRYIQAHDIQEVDPQSPKDELVAAVSRHWYNSVRTSCRLENPIRNVKKEASFIASIMCSSHCLQSRP